MDESKLYVDFSLLPTHIVSHILRFLDINDFKNAVIVCKSWYYASTDPQIERTLTLQPKEEDIPLLCTSNRKYGQLNLHSLKFDKIDSYYFDLFEKFGPSIRKLQIYVSDIKIHHLLKLLEHATQLVDISVHECFYLESLPSLFPVNYDDASKNTIIRNLTSVLHMDFMKFRSIPLVADLVLFTRNLEELEYSIPYCGNSFKDFFTILENCNMQNLKHLHLNLQLCGYVDEFLMRFIKIENVNLKSFYIRLRSRWQDAPNGYLFHQFVLKLKSLEEFCIDKFDHDHLSLICLNLENLKRLDCRQLDNDQPISMISNLKRLEKLYYAVPRNYYENYNIESVNQINNFFACKFEYLRVLYFEEFVTAWNLDRLCQNHPNLIELKLTCVLTRNLETIFKHLTKLRILHIYFGFQWFRPRLHPSQDLLLLDYNTEVNYEYKLSRLRDLEVLYLSEFVPGIHEDEVRKLGKLKTTNVLKFFEKPTLSKEQIVCDEDKDILQ